LGQFEEPFAVKSFRVLEWKHETNNARAMATVFVRTHKGGMEFDAVAEGNEGPVSALSNALRKALSHTEFSKSIADVKLNDYKVRVLDDGRDGTESKVRVLINSSDSTSSWGTVGVSSDVIEASWLALIDGLMYKLMKDSL